MSSIHIAFGKFEEPKEDFPEDVQHLYRNRDYDTPKYLHSKVNVETNKENPRQINAYFSDGLKLFPHKPSDSNYYRMTEEERLENGLVTNLDHNIANGKFLSLFALFTTYAINRSFHSQGPSGVILNHLHKPPLYRTVM